MLEDKHSRIIRLDESKENGAVTSRQIFLTSLFLCFCLSVPLKADAQSIWNKIKDQVKQGINNAIAPSQPVAYPTTTTTGYPANSAPAASPYPPNTPVYPAPSGGLNSVTNSIFAKVNKAIGGVVGPAANASVQPAAPVSSPAYPTDGSYGALSAVTPANPAATSPAMSNSVASTNVGGMEMFTITPTPCNSSADYQFSHYAGVANTSPGLAAGLNRSHKKLGGMYFSDKNMQIFHQQHGN